MNRMKFRLFISPKIDCSLYLYEDALLPLSRILNVVGIRYITHDKDNILIKATQTIFLFQSK